MYRNPKTMTPKEIETEIAALKEKVVTLKREILFIDAVIFFSLIILMYAILKGTGAM